MSATSENRTEAPAQSRTVPFVVGAYPMLPSATPAAPAP